MVLGADAIWAVLTFLQRESVCHSNTPTSACGHRIDQRTDMDIDRTKRIKEARDEAKKEIDTYRKTKEAEFKKFESEVRLRSPSHLRLLSSARNIHLCPINSAIHWIYMLWSNRHADSTFSTRAETSRPKRMRTRRLSRR